MGDLTRDMVQYRGLGQGAAGAADDEGHRHFAGLVIGPTDHGAICDLGVSDQQRLKFGRRDLEALDLDEFLHPVDDEEEALLVDQRQIAGVQPALGIKRPGRRLGVVEVSDHDLGPANPEFALGTGFGIAACVKVDDPGLGVGNEFARRAGRRAPVARHVGNRAHLGHAVTLCNLAVQADGAGTGKVGPKRGGAGDDKFKRRQVVLVDERMLRQRQNHWRHDVEMAHPMRLDQPEHRCEIEARQRHRYGTTGQHHVHQHFHAIDVEEGQDRHRHVAGTDVSEGLDLKRIGNKVAMGQHHPLRQSRGARRVGQHDDRSRRVERNLVNGWGGQEALPERGGRAVARQRNSLGHAGAWNGLGGEGQQCGRDDQKPRAAVDQLVVEFVRGIGRVDGGDGRPGKRGTIEHHREFRAVGRHECDHLPRPYASGRQRAREPARSVDQFGPGHDPTCQPVDQGGFALAPLQAGEDHLGDGQVGNGHVGKTTAIYHLDRPPLRRARAHPAERVRDGRGNAKWFFRHAPGGRGGHRATARNRPRRGRTTGSAALPKP